MADTNERLLKAVRHYQESLDRYSSSGNSEKLLHALEKLARLPIKMCHLEETGVGRTVNSLKKIGGQVGSSARVLVDQWKEMVKDEQNEDEGDEQEEQTHHTSDDDTENDKDQLNRGTKRSRSEESTNAKRLKRTSHSESDSSDSDSESDDNERLTASKPKRHSTSHSSKHGDRSESKKSKSRSDSDSDSRGKSKRQKDSSGSDSSSDEDDSDYKSKSRRRRKSSSSERELSKSTSSKHKSRKRDRSRSDDDKKSKTDKKRDESSKKKHSTDKDKDKKHKSDERDKSKSSVKSDKHSKSRHEDSRKSSSKHSDKKEKCNEDNGKKKHSSEAESRKETSSRSNDKDKRDKSKESDKGNKEKSSSSSSKSHKNNNKVKDDNKETNKSDKIPVKNKEKAKLTSFTNGIDSESGASFAEALGMLEPPKSSRPSGSKKMKSNPKEVRSESGSSFADALGMSDPMPSNKLAKKSKTKAVNESKSKVPEHEDYVPDLLKDKNLEPLDINVSSLLPPPNYKPLGAPVEHNSRVSLNEEDALNRVISMKNKRTKVYSGNKSSWATVPTLFDLCSRVLQENLDALEYTGGVPYSILKHILEKANPNQLYMLEHHNPYLIDDTDELWHLHCQKEFRNKTREEMESWREMYMRCLDEREAKLKALTANIKQSQDKSLPVRTTKLAYVDDVAKPPRNIARKQAKNGTTFVDKKPPLPVRKTQLATAGEAGKIAVPNPAGRAVERSGQSSSSLKPKKAPLMAKMLSMLKGGRFGRR